MVFCFHIININKSNTIQDVHNTVAKYKLGVIDKIIYSIMSSKEYTEAFIYFKELYEPETINSLFSSKDYTSFLEHKSWFAKNITSISHVINFRCNNKFQDSKDSRDCKGFNELIIQ